MKTLKTDTKRFKRVWTAMVALICGIATGLVVYQDTLLTVVLYGVMIGVVLLVGGVVVGSRTERWGELPGLAGTGAAALSISVTFVGTAELAQRRCGGDCEQGGGLGLLAMFAGAYIVFMITMSIGKLLSRYPLFGIKMSGESQ